MDKTLSQDDVICIVEKLLNVQRRARKLGRVLKLPQHIINSIPKFDSDPQAPLLYVIEHFVKQVQPRPTWRVILNALRNKVMDEDRLADEIVHSLTPTETISHDHPLKSSVSPTPAICRTSQCAPNSKATDMKYDSQRSEPHTIGKLHEFIIPILITLSAGRPSLLQQPKKYFRRFRSCEASVVPTRASTHECEGHCSCHAAVHSSSYGTVSTCLQKERSKLLLIISKH